jgi:hypothetical protein
MKMGDYTDWHREHDEGPEKEFLQEKEAQYQRAFDAAQRAQGAILECTWEDKARVQEAQAAMEAQLLLFLRGMGPVRGPQALLATVGSVIADYFDSFFGGNRRVAPVEDDQGWRREQFGDAFISGKKPMRDFLKSALDGACSSQPAGAQPTDEIPF